VKTWDVYAEGHWKIDAETAEEALKKAKELFKKGNLPPGNVDWTVDDADNGPPGPIMG
jgi:hypothetical protein